MMIRFPPKRILAGLDFSEHSWAAWRAAELLGKRLRSEIEIVHVEDLPVPGFPVVERDPKTTIDVIRTRVGPQASIHIVTGLAGPMIVKNAIERSADLVVIGTHGRGGWRRAVLGSVAEGVLRDLPMPALVVKGAAAAERILCPVNFTDYAEVALDYAAKLAFSLQAGLELLNVCDSEADRVQAADRLAAMAAELPEPIRVICRPSWSTAAGDAAQRIIGAAQASDIIVMSGHRKGGLKESFLGSTVERVLRGSPGPVLAMPRSAGAAREPQPGRADIGLKIMEVL